MMQSEKNPFSSDFFFFAPSAAPAGLSIRSWVCFYFWGAFRARCVPLCSLSAEADAAGLGDTEEPISHPKGWGCPCPAPSSNWQRKAEGAFSAPPAQILSARSSRVSSSPCPRLWLCRRNSTPFFRCLPVPTAVPTALLAFPEFC